MQLKAGEENVKKIVTIIGTRPEIIKMSAVLPLLDQEFNHILVHSGQHYSKNMDEIFFHDLGLKEPDYFLEIGSHNPGKQTARIIEKFEEILLKENPDAVIVQGDTNTGLAGALATSKLKEKGIKLIHIEAGARSFNENQAEEINRKIIDLLSNLLLVSQKSDAENLYKEGIDKNKIKITGNTVIDSCNRISKIIDNSEIIEKYQLNNKEYILLTMHRQETVDNKEKLKKMCSILRIISEKSTILFPIHPRTKKQLENFNIILEGKNLKIFDPVGYKEMMGLLKNCKICITDSGGLQEEAAFFKIPTLIIRKETEWTQYVDAGLNKLVNINKELILTEIETLLNNEREYEKRKEIIIDFEKNISGKIVEEIKDLLKK